MPESMPGVVGRFLDFPRLLAPVSTAADIGLLCSDWHVGQARS